jgi:CheY-like chemotaxis protein
MGKNTEILLVEDGDVDAWLTGTVLSECEGTFNFSRVKEGREALDFLLKSEPYQEAQTPDLILLDLHMAGLDGLELLRQIKFHPSLKDIPIVILSSSSHPHDIEETFRCKAIAYLNKPLTREAIQPIIDNLNLFKPSYHS